MSDGGNIEGATSLTPTERKRIAEVAFRDRRAARRNEQRQKRGLQEPRETERGIAHQEALEMDRAITKERKISTGEAMTRVAQRPEFNFIDKPQFQESRFLLDDIGDAIERKSFGEVRKFIGKIKQSFERAEDAQRIDDSINDVIKEQVNTFVKDGDGKHFVACVAFLGDRLRREDFPQDTLEKDAIRSALRKHTISTFEEHYRDPSEVGKQLAEFYRLGLLNRKDVEKMPEIQESVGQRLIANFKARDIGFAELWPVYERIFGSKSETRNELRKLATIRTKEMFRDLEDDPRKPLVRLSLFIDLGLLSEREVRGIPEVLAGVQKALSRVDSYEGTVPDDPLERQSMEEGLRHIRAKFGKNR